MSSLIEQAAKRLEQLREAGIEVPEVTPRAGAAGATPIAAARASEVPRAVFEHTAPGAASGHTSRRITLDPAVLEAAGIITPNAPRSQLADQYRVIKRPLILNATGKGAALVKHGNLILVTSAIAGEGKTYASTFGGEVNQLQSWVNGRQNMLRRLYGDVPIVHTTGSSRCCRAAGRIRAPPNCWRVRRWSACSATWPSVTPTA